MIYKHWITYAFIVIVVYISLYALSYSTCSDPRNVHAMQYILEQDALFIMFSLLPILTILPMEERNMIFMVHVGVIWVHSTVGIYLLVFQRNILEPKYYIGVLILTSVGYLFVVLLGITIYYGGFGANFSLLFDEEREFFSFTQQRGNNAMDSTFNDAFEKINTVIYEPYLQLKNRTCPICLIEYTHKDVIKIMPGCYHTFHTGWIQHWFRNNLSCPFWRQEITREGIDEMRDHSDSSIMHKIIASKQNSREGTFRGQSFNKNEGNFDPVHTTVSLL